MAQDGGTIIKHETVSQCLPEHINIRGTDAVLAREFSCRDAAFSLSLKHFPELNELLASASECAWLVLSVPSAWLSGLAERALAWDWMQPALQLSK